MNMQTVRPVSVNGRDYRFPKSPTVVVCIDGSEPGYIERAIEAGLAPNFARLMTDAPVGPSGTGGATVPTASPLTCAVSRSSSCRIV